MIVPVRPVFVYLEVSQFRVCGLMDFLSTLHCVFMGSFMQYNRRYSGLSFSFLHLHCLW